MTVQAAASTGTITFSWWTSWRHRTSAACKKCVHMYPCLLPATSLGAHTTIMLCTCRWSTCCVTTTLEGCRQPHQLDTLTVQQTTAAVVHSGEGRTMLHAVMQPLLRRTPPVMDHVAGCITHAVFQQEPATQ
jgi:hypothetical protein